MKASPFLHGTASQRCRITNSHCFYPCNLCKGSGPLKGHPKMLNWSLSYPKDVCCQDQCLYRGTHDISDVELDQIRSCIQTSSAWQLMHHGDSLKVDTFYELNSFLDTLNLTYQRDCYTEIFVLSGALLKMWLKFKKETDLWKCEVVEMEIGPW